MSGTALILKGHGGAVHPMAVSRDSRWLLSASEEGGRLWDLHARKCKEKAVLDLDEPVEAVTITRDSRWGVLCQHDTVLMFPLGAGTALGRPTVLEPDGLSRPLSRLILSPDNGWLIAMGGDAANLWSLRGDIVACKGHRLGGGQGTLSACAVSPDGKWLAMGTIDGVVQLWSLSDGRSPSDPIGHFEDCGAVISLSFSPDNRWLAIANVDIAARVYDLTAVGSTDALRRLVGHMDVLTNAAFTFDSERLVTSSVDHTARIWKLAALEEAPIVLEGHSGALTALRITHDSAWLVTASVDRTARIWDLSCDSPSECSYTFAAHSTGVYRLVLGPDSDSLVTMGAFVDSPVPAYMWSISRASDPPTALDYSGIGVTDSVFSPNRRWLIVGYYDGHIGLWET